MKYQPGPLQKIRDVEVDESTVIGDFVNLYECSIGAETVIGDFVEIGKTVVIGKNCKIGSHAYVCPGVIIEDNVHIGERVTFINDRYPRATNSSGQPAQEADWKLLPTVVRQGAFIAPGSVIMGDLTIGEGAKVSPGTVVTVSIGDGVTVAGNPAQVVD